MNKHTPGPWKANISETMSSTVTTQNGIGIARVVDDYDAHLIAAAPMMLDALETAHALIDRLLAGSAGYAEKEQLEIEAAIRAAKGE